MPGWEPDVLPGYWKHTIDLGPDPDGEGQLVATVIRRGDPDEAQPAANAVLAVHGFTDYFFNTELADHFARRGFDFYALDLHKCGRSWREGQTPHFTTDLTRYDTELQQTLEKIGSANVLAYGHSAGGLIVPLWLDRLHKRRSRGGRQVAGLVLNSPWLDLQGPAILRTAPTSAALGALSRIRKLKVVRSPTPDGGYGATLHRDYYGDFDYDLQWKPVGGFPVTFGWIHAIRRGHAKLHRGLDVGVPNLILRSDRSVREVADPDLIQRGDAVLDVDQIARWAGCIGDRTTIVPVTDAKHDVFLSVPESRAAAYQELDRWLDWYLDWLQNSGRTAQSEQG